MQDVYVYFGYENVNNQIQSDEYWHFIRYAQVTLRKWLIIGSLRLKHVKPQNNKSFWNADVCQKRPVKSKRIWCH